MIRLSLARTGPDGPKPHWPGVTALKGLGLVFILIYHGGGVLGRPNRLHGEIGVDVFLLLSGLLLSVQAGDGPARDFWRRRFFRIFPTYWLALTFFVVLGTVVLRRGFSVGDVLIHAAGLHATVRGAYFSDINDSFWFITTIVFLYLVFGGLRRRAGDLLLVLGVGGLTTLVCLLPFPGFDHLSGRLTGFFIGVCLGQLFRGREIRLQPGLIFAAGLAAFAWLEWQGMTSANYPLAALAVAAVFLVVDGWLRPWAAGRLLLAPLGFLGTYSYEIYLFHQPLIRDYNFWFQRTLFQREPSARELAYGMVVAFAVAVALSMAAAALARRRRLQAWVLAGATALLVAWALGAAVPMANAWDRAVAAAQGPLLALVEPGTRWKPSPPPNPALEGWSGPLRLIVKLPAPAAPPALPLVVTGRTGAGDLLGLVRVDAQHVRFTLDHWGEYAWTSADLPLAAAPEHTIDILLGSLLPPAGSPWSVAHPDLAPLSSRLYVAIDGAVAFNAEMAFHPAGSTQAFVGVNPLGGSTTGLRFTGRSLIVEPLELSAWQKMIPAIFHRPSIDPARHEVPAAK